MEHPETLRDTLIGAGITGSHEKKDYHDAVQKMLNKKLSPTARALYGLVSFISLIVTLYFGSWVFKGDYGSDIGAFIMRLMCGVGMIFSGILAFFAGWSAVTAKIRGRFYPGFIFGSAIVALCYFWTTNFYMMFTFPIGIALSDMPDASVDYRPILGTQVMLLGFFAMIAFGLIFIFRLLNDLKFTHQSKLLQIEYKICELLEKSEKKDQ